MKNRNIYILITLLALIVNLQAYGSKVDFLNNGPNNNNQLEIYRQRDFNTISLTAVNGMSLQNLTSIIAWNRYRGTWISNSEIDQFNFLTMSKGNSYMIFLTNTTTYLYRESEAIIENMEIQLLNPTYQEEREVFSIFNLETYNETTMSWQGQTVLNYSEFEKFKNQDSSYGNCMVNYSVIVSFEDLNAPSNSNCGVQVFVNSLDTNICAVDFQIQYQLDTSNYQLQVILYCLFTNIICAGQFICVTKLCKDFLENDQDVQRVSMLTITFITIYDSYLCLQNLYFALLNYYFIIPAFFYFLLSTTCDMKLIWIVWRARYVNEIMDHQQMRKAVAMFFVQFYAGLITFFVLMYFFELDNWFILLNSLFIVPQIIHNALRGNNPKFIPEYVFGVLASNMLYPLYFRGCPYNFRGLQPSILFCVLWVSLFLIQIFFLYIQYKFGPRSFIPKFLLPKQFKYYQTFSINNDEELDDCAICLGSLLMEPEQMEQNLDQKFIAKKIMITPCNHKFHIPCLTSWLDVKLSCPTCRKDIPPVNP